jgi:hypothetical protein
MPARHQISFDNNIMKNSLENRFIALVLAIGLFAAGCGSVGGVFTPTVTKAPVVLTNQVAQVQTVVLTNVVLVTQTNGINVTNTVTEVETVTNEVTELVTNLVNVTNYTVSQATSNVLGAATLLNSASSIVNPYSMPIGLALAGLSGVLGFWARLKSQQAATHASVAQTVITAIEGLDPAIGAAVKAAVAAKSAKMGTLAEVSSVVAAVTANL